MSCAHNDNIENDVFSEDENVLYLRMVPTFVSAHTFCASHNVWFQHHVHAGVDIDAINCIPTEYTTKMKAEFSQCYGIKFNERLC